MTPPTRLGDLLEGRRSWLLPLVVGLVVLGPVLMPGALINLDLVLVPHLDTPSGFWGLGPELPRRLPMWVPISWASAVVPATATGKLLLLASLVVPWVGMSRLTSRLAPSATVLTCQVAGALYALSPFVLTRSLVGHFMVTVPHAVLPWVLPVLVKPGRRLGSTFLAALLLGVAGHFGGAVAVGVVLVSILCGQRERWGGALAVTLAAQAPWLVPGLLVAATTDIDMASGTAFPTALGGLDGLARLSAGDGFWNTYYQVGGTGMVGTVVGAGLLMLALIGHRAIGADYRRPLAVIGAAGWLVAAASTLRGFDTVIATVDEVLLQGLLRDSHRLLGLHLLWLAPASALGAQGIADWLRSTRRPGLASAAMLVPCAAALALSLPGVWGFGGRLAATPLPSAWNTIRDRVQDAPGTVLALPWYQYFNLTLPGDGTRRVLNPLPLHLGGDVLSSSDNGLQDDVREFGDPRESVADAIVDDMRTGAPVADDLADLGVRWVVVIDVPGLDDYPTLDNDGGLEPVVEGDGIALYEVAGWPGQATDITGTSVDLNMFGPAFARPDSSDALILNRSGSSGWRRGWTAAATSADGRVAAPAGSGPVWHVATVPALAAQIAPLLVAVAIGRRHRAGARREKIGVSAGHPS